MCIFYLNFTAEYIIGHTSTSQYITQNIFLHDTNSVIIHTRHKFTDYVVKQSFMNSGKICFRGTKMTKIGADVNGKPADPGSAERGVAPPVVLQPVPQKVNTRYLTPLLQIKALWILETLNL